MSDSPIIQVLLVEDNLTDAVLLRTTMSKASYGKFIFTHVNRLDEALECLGRQAFDVILLDLGLPDSQGLNTLERMHGKVRRLPVVVLTGLPDEALAVRALQKGAQDYLVKGEAAANIMARSIRYAIERKRAEEALWKSEERFRRYFELGLIGMVITLPDKMILEVNDELCRMFGFAREELLQKTWAELTHAEDLDADVANFMRILAGQSDGYTLDKRFIRKDGRIVDTTISVKCLRREDRSVEYFVALVQDITERKAAEEASKRREVELAHLSRITTMGQMASGLAHELNQPLGAILNYASVCRQHLESNEGARATALTAIQEVMNETRRAGAIISRMRSFVRKQQPQIFPLDINELVRESLRLMDFELKDQRIRPHLELAADVPKVLGDVVRIEQVLINLLFNALEAMGESQASRNGLTVQTVLQADGRSVQVCVADTGPGISLEGMDRLFEPFFTTKSRGLGMGLNISRSIIESLGGRLWAAPNPQRGMRFCFTVPVAGGLAP